MFFFNGAFLINKRTLFSLEEIVLQKYLCNQSIHSVVSMIILPWTTVRIKRQENQMHTVCHHHQETWVVVSIMFHFLPLLGEDFQFDQYFSDGLVQPPTRNSCGKH